MAVFPIQNRFLGHIALDTELLLRLNRDHIKIIFFQYKKSANRLVEQEIRTKAFVWPKFLLFPTYQLFVKWFPSAARGLGFKALGKWREFQYLHLLAGSYRSLGVTTITSADAESTLEKFSLRKYEYVCIGIRDGKYHAHRAGNESENYRNQEFHDYLAAISLNPNITFVRVGRGSTLPVNMPNLIDYRNSALASDEVDIVLLKYSKGLISTGDGIAALAHVLNIPTLLVSYSPWEWFPTYSEKNWIVPMMFKDPDSKCFLSMSEIYNRVTPGHFMNEFVSRNVNIIHRYSPVEIAEYVQTFLTHIFSTIESDDQCKSLRQFWNLFKRALPTDFRNFHPEFHARIPVSFLTTYARLLLPDFRSKIDESPNSNP